VRSQNPALGAREVILGKLVMRSKSLDPASS